MVLLNIEYILIERAIGRICSIVYCLVITVLHLSLVDHIYETHSCVGVETWEETCALDCEETRCTYGYLESFSLIYLRTI